MIRHEAVSAIRALLDVSLNATDYPLTVEPEFGKTGDWQFRVLTTDVPSHLTPSGHINWHGTNWRKPVATPADRKGDTTAAHMETVTPSPPAAKPNPVRLTEAELRAIVSNFLRTQNMAGFAFTLHDITDNSARFSGPEGGTPVRPVWSGKVTWTTVGRCGNLLLIDSDVKFDKPTKPAAPVPDLTATDLGPFYAAKVKADVEHMEAAATARLAELERAHRLNMDDIDAALKQLKATDPPKPDAWAPPSAAHHAARSPMTRLQIAIADYEAARQAQLHSMTTHPDAPTREALERAVIAAARDVCREAASE